jgi:parallel beta-helix repeat protein
VIVRGQGMHETVLRFDQQLSGGQGIFVSGDAVTFEDLAVENTPGDGIRAEGVDGISFRRVRVEWTRGPSEENGAYGLYPVLSDNVLVEGCVVIGSRDAGIYVGQSRKIIVRDSRVEFNVAGIEIENSIDADVYDNVATRNTGGILVFDLPGLSQYGERVRVYRNRVFENNTPNFGIPGTTVSLIPAGTGMLVMAHNDVEIFRNHVFDHNTFNLAIASYLITFTPWQDPNYYPWPERIFIHHNRLSGSGLAPDGLFGALLTAFFGTVPDIIWDGYTNPASLDPDGTLRDDLEICIRKNGKHATFGDANGLEMPGTTDLAPHDCRYPRLKRVRLDPPLPLPPPDADEPSDAEVAALCTAPGTGPNWAAAGVDCPELSDYRLFAAGAAGRVPSGGGVPYDLTTPLFSDYTQKYRFVFVPPAAAAAYDASRPFEFPVGTIIAKTFTFAHDLRDVAAGEDVVETRLLIRREDGWVGLPYLWDEGEAEAHLAVGGGAVDASWIHADGSLRSTTYEIPNVNQCARCHVGGEGVAPVGTKAALLNRDYAYAGGSANQIAHWAALGILAGAPEPAEAPRIPEWDDPLAGTLEERAKGYLDSNCAHCHNPLGRARGTGLFLEYTRLVGPSYGVCKTSVAAGSGTGGRKYDIVPGDPDLSILVYRLGSAEAGIAMPELGKSVVHDEGLALVSEWIASLPGSCPP